MTTVEVYEKVTKRRMFVSFVKEILQVLALALVCILAVLMIRAALAEDDGAAAEIEEPRGAVTEPAEAVAEPEAAEAPEPGETDPAPPEAFVPSALSGPTKEEIDLIERVVMAESGNQPYEGIMAVAEVVMNRSELWGMSITEVLEYPEAFTDPHEGDVPERVKTAVRDTLAGIYVFKVPVTHFHNTSVMPDWAKSKTFAGRIGDHLFYY
ncbi:MAG: cell wall hydrolase [Clostridiales Family XIII bacterium]|jgi:N-acetylmuramoyl-L-alanine amidase|nr:cell wall hydrolase [Clostridiales Family XIII bacterium]